MSSNVIQWSNFSQLSCSVVLWMTSLRKASETTGFSDADKYKPRNLALRRRRLHGAAQSAWWHGMFLRLPSHPVWVSCNILIQVVTSSFHRFSCSLSFSMIFHNVGIQQCHKPPIKLMVGIPPIKMVIFLGDGANGIAIPKISHYK